MAVASSTIEPTPRGQILLGLAAAALLGAILDREPNVRLAAALLAAPLLIDFLWKARRLHRLTIQVAPRRTVAGAPFRETLTLHNPRRVTVRELLVAEPRTRGNPALLGRLAAGEAQRVTLECQSGARGHLLERVFTLATEWPLGLFRARATIVAATDFVIEPMRVQLAADLVHAVAENDPAPYVRSRLEGDEFHALREHQPTEEARGVHALRSAALGTLVRTVLRGRHPREVGIVLDLRRPPGRPLGLGQRRFEWSLGAVATLLDRLVADGTSARVLVIGSRTVRAVIDDAGRHREFATFLSEATPSAHRPLDVPALRELDGLEQVFWIPAGGYRSPTEQRDLRATVRVLGEGEA